MGSINSLTGLKNVDFASLQNVASGKYNKGEISLKAGKDGTLSFGKVNNSVFKTWNNDVTAARIQNSKTNAAVFKAILTHYAAGEAIDNVLSKKVGELNDEAFSGFSNPYIKEAFNFLMTGEGKGDPLSRDEMRFLFKLLDEGTDDSAGQVADNMEVLRALHTYKTKGGEAVDEGMRTKLETVQGNDSIIKGLSVSNSKSREVKKVTVNAAAAGAHKSAPKSMMQRIVATRQAAAGGSVGATGSAAGANAAAAVKTEFTADEITQARKYLDDKQKELNDKLRAIDEENEKKGNHLDVNDKHNVWANERRACVNAHVMRCLADKTYIAACGKFHRYTTGRDFFNDPKNQDCFNEVVNDSRGNRMQKDQYIRFAGQVYTNDMIRQIRAMYPGLSIAAYIFADATRCGCGLTWGFPSQEEGSLRDVNAAEIIGSFIAHGIVDMGTPSDDRPDYHQYNYTESEHGDLPVSPASEGFTTEVDLQRVNIADLPRDDNENVGQKGSTSYVFRAGASLDPRKTSSDINGSVQYLCDSWLLNDGVDVSDKESRKLAKKFITEFKQRLVASELDGAVKNEAMAIATCAGLTDAFDVFNVKDVDKLLKIVKDRSIGGSSEAYKTLLDKSRKNYYETLRLKIRADIVKARAEGKEVFVVGGIGCGEFANDINEVAKILAEELFNHGGNMKSAFAGKDSLRKVFDKAYAEICLQNGVVSSLKLEEVKANPSMQADQFRDTLSAIVDFPKSAFVRYSLMETALKDMYKELFIGADGNIPEPLNQVLEDVAKLLSAGDKRTDVLEANGLLCKTLRQAIQAMTDLKAKTALDSFVTQLEHGLEDLSGIRKFDVNSEMLASRAKILDNPTEAANQLAQNIRECALHSKTYSARDGVANAVNTQLDKMFTEFSSKDKVDADVKKRLRDMVAEKRKALKELSESLVDSYDAENMKKGCKQLKVMLDSAIAIWRDCFTGTENEAQHRAFKEFSDSLFADLTNSVDGLVTSRRERLDGLVGKATEEIDKARIEDDKQRIEDGQFFGQMKDYRPIPGNGIEGNGIEVAGDRGEELPVGNENKVSYRGKLAFDKDHLLHLMSMCDIQTVGKNFLDELARNADGTDLHDVLAALGGQGLTSISFNEEDRRLVLSPGFADDQVKEDFVKLLNALNEKSSPRLPGAKDFVLEVTRERLQTVPKKLLLDELVRQRLHTNVFPGENVDALLRERGITAFSFGQYGAIQLSPTASDAEAQRDFARLLDLRDEVKSKREEAARKAEDLKEARLMAQYRKELARYQDGRILAPMDLPEKPKIVRSVHEPVKAEDAAWADIFYADFLEKDKYLGGLKQKLEDTKVEQADLLKAGDTFLRQISGKGVMGTAESREKVNGALKKIFVFNLTVSEDGRLTVRNGATEEDVIQDFQQLLGAYMNDMPFRRALDCAPGNVTENLDAFVKEIGG